MHLQEIVSALRQSRHRFPPCYSPDLHIAAYQLLLKRDPLPIHRANPIGVNSIITMNVTSTNSTAATNFTQPAECVYSRDSFPSLPAGMTNYAEVPLYQQNSPHLNKTEVLKECCQQGQLWIYANPKPCTAVCSSNSSKAAIQVQNCLSLKRVNFGSQAANSAAMPRVGVRKSTWSLLLVGGLVLSGMLF